MLAILVFLVIHDILASPGQLSVLETTVCLPILASLVRQFILSIGIALDNLIILLVLVFLGILLVLVRLGVLVDIVSQVHMRSVGRLGILVSLPSLGSLVCISILVILAIPVFVGRLFILVNLGALFNLARLAVRVSIICLWLGLGRPGPNSNI